MEELKSVSIEELVSYSKEKEVPAVTIIENITKFEYISLISKRLFIEPYIVQNTDMVAFIGNAGIAQKIARELGKRSQIMYYDFVKVPNGITIYGLTGYTSCWNILRDEGYIVKAYDETGKKCRAWQNTNVKEVEPKYLNSLKLSKFNCYVQLSGKNRCKNLKILEHSRINYINGGIYNEDRNCYYPKDLSNNVNIAEKNKLEKLFKKWGFKRL